MKREGNLIHKISSYENLMLAFYKAANAKRGKKEVIDYEQHLDKNVALLQKQIISGNIEVGTYHYFKIYDPKERVICAAPFSQRVLHHAIMNVCHHFFERQLIYHTYATRSGKGTYAAIEQAKKSVLKFNYVAKLDVQKYFDNVDHAILKEKLARIFKDKILLSCFGKIIDSYSLSEGKGIPIGNLTSQYFANYYLSSADHFAKEQLKIPAFIRYMDDMLLFEHEKKALLSKTNNFTRYVCDNGQLSLKEPIVKRCEQGIPFLGYKILPYKIMISRRSKSRFLLKLRKYNRNLEKGLWSQKEYQNRVLPLFAFVQKADSVRFLQNYV
jgi:retron-type reverse transcriptase